METIFAWGNQATGQWRTVLAALLVLVCAMFTVRAFWKLLRYAESSSSKTSRERYHWIMFPWKHEPTRTATTLLFLTIGAVLFLFLFPSAEYNENKVPDVQNPGVQKEIDKTKIPTGKQLHNDAIKKDKKTRKDNFKNVNSPGIRYKPPKIDPEKNINEILKRAQDRDKKETKK